MKARPLQHKVLLKDPHKCGLGVKQPRRKDDSWYHVLPLTGLLIANPPRVRAHHEPHVSRERKQRQKDIALCHEMLRRVAGWTVALADFSEVPAWLNRHEHYFRGWCQYLDSTLSDGWSLKVPNGINVALAFRAKHYQYRGPERPHVLKDFEPEGNEANNSVGLVVALRLVESFTSPGDFIVDPWATHGNFGVAAAHLGRHYFGITQDWDYYEAVKERVARAYEGNISARDQWSIDRYKRTEPYWLIGET